MVIRAVQCVLGFVQRVTNIRLDTLRPLRSSPSHHHDQSIKLFFFFLFTKSPFFLFLFRNRENEILFGIVSKRAIYIVPCSS